MWKVAQLDRKGRLGVLMWLDIVKEWGGENFRILFSFIKGERLRDNKRDGLMIKKHLGEWKVCMEHNELGVMWYKEGDALLISDTLTPKFLGTNQMVGGREHELNMKWHG